MENEKELESEEISELPEVAEGEEDNTDYKALAAKNAGIAKRLKTKLDKSKIDSKVNAKVEKELEKKEGLDRLDKAILRVEKITGEEEIKLVEDMMKESGKSLEQVLESKFFKAELKELRDSEATKDATPKGTKRSGQSPKNDVDYWLEKGMDELPEGDPELARKVVNARLHKIKSVNQFTDEPVA